jgi:hypothetical protein
MNVAFYQLEGSLINPTSAAARKLAIGISVDL